ncbi:MAG TPA: ATP-dependent DNA helicase RecG [Thermoanaerobaculia bacterium]
MALRLDTPVQFLKGVGEARAALFATAGIETAQDLLFLFPFRYEDRRHPARIADLGRSLDVPVLIRGRVVSAGTRVSPVKRLKLFEAILDDGSGSVKLIWFNQPYLAKQIERGARLAVFGTPRAGGFGPITLESPEWERFDGTEGEDGAIVPIYPKTGNIPQKVLRRLVGQVLDAVELADPLPEPICRDLGVIPLAAALQQLHRPDELSDDFIQQRSPAHRRVILQEFFTFQLAMRVRRAGEETKKKTRRIRVDDEIRSEVKRVLPFRLTTAQKRVLREIAGDLQAERPMYRLLQGDVGSGKTIVALVAALIAIRNGHQVALLAPTEILVEQHYQRIRQLVDDSIVVARSTGSMKSAERKTVLAGLKEGSIQLIVGTHALLEPRVEFRSLGFAIVDEQHRFGVEQRQKLFRKGELPDILVMTATPIPRSLALAIYGDLELSVIDELPPGRQRITTAVRSTSELERVCSFMDEQLAGGAQAYVVYPIIEESEKLNLKPLTQGFETIRSRFPQRRVAFLHGRMKAAEKEETMGRFKNHEIDILVATTVIEVGIDVPNASIMLIVDADRFGLSQLHQLRGRVGRGARKSWCVLLRDETSSSEAKQRLGAFEKSRDGFEVAEHDLQTRGPGEFLGTRQSGAMRFRMGHILRDQALMENARDLAISIIARDLAASARLAGRLLGAPVPVAAVRD